MPTGNSQIVKAALLNQAVAPFPLLSADWEIRITNVSNRKRK
jgi:hypothetical protein